MKGRCRVINDMTVFDSNGDFNLYYLDESNSVFQTTARFCNIDMSDYNSMYEQPSSGRLLDSVYVYAETPTPDSYFDTMFHGVSPVGIFSQDHPAGKLLEYRDAKSRFFSSARERGSISTADNIVANDVPLSDVVAAINPGTLALLSIPAFMVLALMNFVALDANRGIGRGYYQTAAPPRLQNLEAGPVVIDGFDDYLEAFHFGNFLSNNADLFLTVYGLAHSIAHFKWQVEDSKMCEAGNIENLVSWKPFTQTWNELVRIGAMRDPFNVRRDGSHRYSRFGILNGDELNPDLHAALVLTDLLVPCFASLGAPYEKLSIFYGLIDVFPLRNYFNIKHDKRIKFVE